MFCSYKLIKSVSGARQLKCCNPLKHLVSQHSALNLFNCKRWSFWHLSTSTYFHIWGQKKYISLHRDQKIRNTKNNIMQTGKDDNLCAFLYTRYKCILSDKHWVNTTITFCVQISPLNSAIVAVSILMNPTLTSTCLLGYFFLV